MVRFNFCTSAKQHKEPVRITVPIRL